VQTLGNQQSPVKIITAEAFPIKFGSDYLQFHYSKALPGKFGGDNFNVDPPGNKEDHTPWTITVGGTQWLIRKIHIHKKAEHLLDSDTPRPFECHMLHSAADDPAATGDKLVIGVFTVPRAKAPRKKSIRLLNEKLCAAMQVKGGTTCCEMVHALDPDEFLPIKAKRSKWYRYEGSLTSWPFTEDVTWIVMREDAHVVTADFNEIDKGAEQEERPVFPLNRRFVLRSFG
jgi:carbonic anhydrase